MKSFLEGRLSATFAFQARQGELDVFAGTQGVHREIGAGTIVLEQLVSPNLDPIGLIGLRIRHFEPGKNKIVAEVFQPIFLFSAEFPPERDLPFLQAHAFRFPSAGGFSGLRRAPFCFLGTNLHILRFRGLF
jgi:hypothetical protein